MNRQARSPPISVSRELYDKIVEKVKESKGEFESPDAFVQFVLSEVLAEDMGSGGKYPIDDERKVVERLKKLGYE